MRRVGTPLRAFAHPTLAVPWREKANTPLAAKLNLIWIKPARSGGLIMAMTTRGEHRSQPGDFTSGECHEEANLA
jgi:hypothetical protein